MPSSWTVFKKSQNRLTCHALLHETVTSSDGRSLATFSVVGGLRNDVLLRRMKNSSNDSHRNLYRTLTRNVRGRSDNIKNTLRPPKNLLVNVEKFNDIVEDDEELLEMINIILNNFGDGIMGEGVLADITFKSAHEAFKPHAGRSEEMQMISNNICRFQLYVMMVHLSRDPSLARLTAITNANPSAFGFAAPTNAVAAAAGGGGGDGGGGGGSVAINNDLNEDEAPTAVAAGEEVAGDDAAAGDDRNEDNEVGEERANIQVVVEGGGGGGGGGADRLKSVRDELQKARQEAEESRQEAEEASRENYRLKQENKRLHDELQESRQEAEESRQEAQEASRENYRLKQENEILKECVSTVKASHEHTTAVRSELLLEINNMKGNQEATTDRLEVVEYSVEENREDIGTVKNQVEDLDTEHQELAGDFAAEKERRELKEYEVDEEIHRVKKDIEDNTERMDELEEKIVDEDTMDDKIETAKQQATNNAIDHVYADLAEKQGDIEAHNHTLEGDVSNVQDQLEGVREQLAIVQATVQATVTANAERPKPKRRMSF
jgi:hypothetical protein